MFAATTESIFSFHDCGGNLDLSPLGYIDNAVMTDYPKSATTLGKRDWFTFIFAKKGPNEKAPEHAPMMRDHARAFNPWTRI